MLTFEQSSNIDVGLILNGPGLGDNLILTSLPENFFRNTGRKLIDVNRHNLFDHNPFVDRTGKAEIFCSGRGICDEASSIKDRDKVRVFSIPQKILLAFSLPKCYLRHPRLYFEESSRQRPNKVVVHTTGKSIGGKLGKKVMDQIFKNYEGYDIVQVGGPKDEKMKGAADRAGLDVFNTAREISEAAIFIGVDSSMLHLASCYPKVRKKVLINYFKEEHFEKFTPLQGDAAWWEFNIEAYCPFDYDVGAAMSWKKI